MQVHAPRLAVAIATVTAVAAVARAAVAPAATVAATAATAPAAAAELSPAVADDRFGCGWFDSSLDLNEGLVVVEDFDPILFELWAALPAPARPTTLH